VTWFLHHAKRIVRITSGIMLLLVGLVLMLPGVPGPGILLAIAGLGILAVDFVWARRLKTHLKDRADKMAARVRRKPPKDAPPEKT
jgi:drug/metabolite transporter (DMT)-like permease